MTNETSKAKITFASQHPFLAHLAEELAADLSEDGYQATVTKSVRLELRESGGGIQNALRYMLQFTIENAAWEASGALLLAKIRTWWKARKLPASYPTELLVERWDENGILRERIVLKKQ